jgi:hypothetical protein
MLILWGGVEVTSWESCLERVLIPPGFGRAVAYGDLKFVDLLSWKPARIYLESHFEINLDSDKERPGKARENQSVV